MSSKTKIYFIIFVIALSISPTANIGCMSMPNSLPQNRGYAEIEWEKASAPRDIIANDAEYSLLWVNSDVYIPKSHETPYMAIISDKIVLLGSLNKTELERLTAFELNDGRLAWQTPVDENISSAFSSNSEYVYVGFHSARIKAYEPHSGDIVWDVRLGKPDSSSGFITSRLTNIDVLTATETELLVKSNLSHVLFLNPNTGKTIENRRDHVEMATVYVDEDMILSQPSISQMIAMSKETGLTEWQFELEDLGFQQTPIVNNDFVVLKAGPLPLEALGSVWVLHKNSGEVIWESAENVGSNPAIYNNRLYFLSMDAKLHVIDLLSGQEINTIQFYPARLDDSYVIREFHVEAFEDIVVVYFGDSAQLFVLRLE